MGQSSQSKMEFRAFDPDVPVRIYRRNLPHWRQDGATYAATFRLADSIPQHVLLRWRDEDRLWFEANGIMGSPSESPWKEAYEALPEARRQSFERRAAHRLHVEIDQCHGSCLLGSPEVRDLVMASLMHFHGRRWWVGDAVVMPNHVHALLLPFGTHELEATLGAVKGYVSTRLSRLGLKAGRLWQAENYDRLVRGSRELTAWRRYIRENPNKACVSEASYTLHCCDWLGPEP